mmetsp:Transcript_29785/g.40920  ORF Transcript_29785/g.40920 Transcript_29785/m.40920 type:complete len:205 (-) Transcript_29785:649-1263(-)
MYGFVSGIFKIIRHNHAEARCLDEFLSFFHISSFQSDDNRLLHANLLSGIDHSHGNHITTHNASEYVNKDGLDLFVCIQQLKGFLDLALSGTTAYIQEVRRVAPFELDDVHSGHRETRSIHHAANVASEADVVQVVLGCLHLSRILLRAVSKLKHRSLSELRVIIEVDLGIAHHYFAIRCLCERIHLHERAVVGSEHLVELLHH